MQDPAALSVDEIRRRYAEGAESVSPRLLRRLLADPRQGVQRLARAIERQRERDRAERLRLEGMLRLERVLWRSGIERIAGVDEVGMGTLAGPVIAAAVVFASDAWIEGVDDSKRVEPEERERLAREIERSALGVGIGRAEPAEIDELNVYQAGLVAMRRAVRALPVAPQHVLVDARTIPELELPQNAFEKGDGESFSIAAASIVAKTHRDRLMLEYDAEYPVYGFAAHKGYCTQAHQDAVRAHGPCPIHRRSYPFLRELEGRCSDLFYALKERLGALRAAEGCAAFEAELEASRASLADEELRKLRTLLARRWKLV